MLSKYILLSFAAFANSVPFGQEEAVSCTNGVKRCSGQYVQYCLNNQWYRYTTCGSNQYCDPEKFVCASNSPGAAGGSTVTVAPYFYSWGNGDSSYACSTLTDAYNKAGLRAATMAFAIMDAQNNVASLIYSELNDIKAFVALGGHLTVSVGGANGPYIEPVLTLPNLIAAFEKLLDSTGTNSLDFDVEGAMLADVATNTKRAQAIAAIQAKRPGLFISFTVPVMAASQWDNGGLPAMAVALLKNAVVNGVNVGLVNIMAMDYYQNPAGDLGKIACTLIDTVKTQLSAIFTMKTPAQLYKMIGVTPMIGKNDDSTFFTLANAQTLRNCAVQKNIGLLAYWAFQRDQVGKGDNGVYSNNNDANFDYYNILSGKKTVTIPATPALPTNPVQPIQQPAVPQAPGAVCVNGKYQCNGQNVQVCNVGQWSTLTTCASNTVCSPKAFVCVPK